MQLYLFYININKYIYIRQNNEVYDRNREKKKNGTYLPLLCEFFKKAIFIMHKTLCQKIYYYNITNELKNIYIIRIPN